MQAMPSLRDGNLRPSRLGQPATCQGWMKVEAKGDGATDVCFTFVQYTALSILYPSKQAKGIIRVQGHFGQAKTLEELKQGW